MAGSSSSPSNNHHNHTTNTTTTTTTGTHGGNNSGGGGDNHNHNGTNENGGGANSNQNSNNNNTNHDDGEQPQNQQQQQQPSRPRIADDDEDGSSENEFSYDDSEEEETDDEEEDDDEEEEDDDDDEEDDDEEDDDEEDDEEDDEDDEEEGQVHEDEEEEDGPLQPSDQQHPEGSSERHAHVKKPKVRHERRSESDEERRRQRKLFKKQLNAAANKIQSHWKKQKAKSPHPSANATANTSAEEDGETRSSSRPAPDQASADTPTNSEPTAAGHAASPASPSSRAEEGLDYSSAQRSVEKSSAGEKENVVVATSSPSPREQQQQSQHQQPQPSSPKHKKKKKDKDDSGSKTVPPPLPEILEWSRNLSERKCRKNVASGMRVKVRFSAKVKREGKVVKKKIWYGGRVSAVSKEGSKIRIKYDDGTSEISKFPDKDVVVDETSNGEHLVVADRFVPPSMRGPHVQEEEEPEEEEFVETEEMFEKAKSSSPSNKPTENEAEVEESSSSAPATEPAASKEEEPKPIPLPPQEPAVLPKDNPSPTPVSVPPETSNVTPVKPPTELSESTDSKPEEEPKDMEIMTPVRKKPEEEEEEYGPSVHSTAVTLPKGLLSPEEGELSPGITVIKNPSKPKQIQPDPTPMEMEMESPDKAAETKPPADDDASASAAPKIPIEEEAQIEKVAKSVGRIEKSPDEKKLSLTIRIPNVKQASPPQPLQSPPSSKPPQISTPKSPRQPSDGETSEEELFADTPVTQREVKSIDLRKTEGSKKKLSKKRHASSDSADAPNPKRRIYLKRDREAAAAAAAAAQAAAAGGAETTKEETPGAEIQAEKEGGEPGEMAQALEVVQIPSLAPMPSDQPASSSSPKEPRICISLRKHVQEPTELEMPMAPASTKTKRKKDRSASPNPRKSPVNQRRASPVNETSQEPESSSPAVLKPVSQEIKRSGSAESGPESTLEMSPAANKSGIIGSKNSAFARKSPVPKEAIEEVAAEETPSQSDVGDPMETEESSGVPGKLTKQGSRASSEASLSTGRSGRRAAQQAKEKLNSKSEPPGQESGRKKKKRRRKDGNESGGDDSDHSDDDPQWVQCEQCEKWRILPSSVDASSLPKHWYCHLNVYDPKRNNCAAPEQTLKQVAKERRRAKKRAKQQRLEQAQLESIPEVSAPKEKAITPVNSPKSTKVVISAKKLASISAETKRGAAATPEEPQQSDSGSDSLQKTEKKTRKGRQPKEKEKEKEKEPEKEKEKEKEKDDSHHSGSEIPSEQPKVKVGRKRGRPARNPPASSQEKKDDDNVQWVQCEKCDKWRKLPPHIEPDELPDRWYCSMNTWNPDSASCESPEDKADASHLEVGKGQGQVPQGNPGKNSYRSLIFGTGRKHNRPLSERSRAAESLFMRPVDDEENPHPSVMYSKSSVFMPRTSNFTKANAAEEKPLSIFDVLANSDLWTELSGFGHFPQTVPSNAKVNKRGGYPKFVTFENLPDDIRRDIREAVLLVLGSSAHTADDLIRFMKSYSWDSEMTEVSPYFNADTIINALLALVRDGIVEMACFRDPSVPMEEWVPKYRRVRSQRALASEAAMKASKCMKIRKPWKQREETSAEWISGGAAFT